MKQFRSILSAFVAVAVFVFSSGLSVTAHTCLRSGEAHAELFATSDACAHEHSAETAPPACCAKTVPACCAKPVQTAAQKAADDKCCDTHTEWFKLTSAAHLAKDAAAQAAKIPAPAFGWPVAAGLSLSVCLADVAENHALPSLAQPPSGRSLRILQGNFRI